MNEDNIIFSNGSSISKNLELNDLSLTSSHKKKIRVKTRKGRIKTLANDKIEDIKIDESLNENIKNPLELMGSLVPNNQKKRLEIKKRKHVLHNFKHNSLNFENHNTHTKKGHLNQNLNLINTKLINKKKIQIPKKQEPNHTN